MACKSHRQTIQEPYVAWEHTALVIILTGSPAVASVSRYAVLGYYLEW